ncbi:hypothetical protein JX265_002250 [Neoarthrinium moseri]|uniref:Uncharacterized protein n=1 Tax=Neoarthrinium moseri TaxID=1658444 RepID=A0A9Q0AUL3_9PEZI|nr:hypothetical protein JX265_002250 [Neoarthrinium moseri]
MMAPRAPETTTAPFHPRWAGMGMDRLFERAGPVGTNTCGYISGTSSYYALTCDDIYTCTNSGSYRGCCSSSACSASTNFYTACYDATAAECSATSLGSNSICCNIATEYPYCVTYLWSTSVSPGQLFTEFNCDRSAFSGQYFLAATSPSTTSTSSATTRSGTSASVTISSSAAAVVTPDSSSSSSSGSSTNTGAIAGGVVGGVVVLALIGLGVWFLLRKKKSVDNDNTSPPTQPQPDMAQSAGYPSPPPPGTPGYDPRFSFAAAHSQMSPTTPGYPSPQGTPSPYYDPQLGGYYGAQKSEQGHNASFMYAQSTGGQAGKDMPGHDGSIAAGPAVPHHYAEMDGQNPVGTIGNRAELS